MKKQILDALKAKFEGVSESVLNRIAEKLAKTVTKEEDVAAAIEEVTLQQVIDSYADGRATEATQSAVSNYEKKHGLKDGVKADNGGEQKNEPKAKTEDKDDIGTLIAAAVKEAVTPLAEQLQAINGDKIQNARTTQFNDAISKLPAKQKALFEKSFARMKFENDEEFTVYLEELKPEVETIVTEEEAKGATFGRPLGGRKSTGKEASEKECDEIAERIMGK